MIFFSVIIPTFNRAHMIAETIDTVLQQTYTHYELVLVDDGSTDNTKQFIESRYVKESRVRYFYKENEERGAARNFGLQQAKGDYAVFLDSDDWMKRNYLESLNMLIKKYSNIFLLATKYDYNNGGKTENHFTLNQLSGGWYDRNYFLTGNILACNYCIRIKERTYEYFPVKRVLTTTEDWLFLLKNMQNQKIFISNEVCVTMRQHNERSMNNNQQVIEARKKATEWIIENLNFSKSEISKLKAWSHYFCAIHQYLDYKRYASLKEIVAAIKEAGMNKKFLLMFSKSIIGRKIIKAIK